MKKKYSGYTEKTVEHFLLDAGAFFKNYDVETDTFSSAVTAGKILGATQGGGEFAATVEGHQIEVDGTMGKVKGLERIDTWAISIKAKLLEVTKDALVLALGAAKVDTTTSTDYDIIEGKSDFELSDYTDNITWVGCISGSEKPVIIQVLNALSIEGLGLTTEDKKEAVLEVTFHGHYAAEDLETPPYKIYYPKIVVKA